jgi:spermidine/putrescine transport system permease protein
MESKAIPGFSATKPVAFGVFLYLYIPIFVLIALSFSASESPLAAWGGLSLRWYNAVLQDDDMLRAAKNSLIVATCVTAIGTAIAIMVALATTGQRLRGQRFIEVSLGLPLIAPDIVSAIAMLLFFVFIGIPLGLESLILAHTVFAIPIAYLPIRARLAGLDTSLTEAASDLYATPVGTFRRVILPLIWPGIASGAMLAFIGSLGDVVISYFVSGPGSTTLPVYVFSMVRMGVTPAVNAVSTMLIALSATLVTLSYLLSRRFG